jgi:outer membrane receptor for ferrienterochelin and colicin
VFFICVGILANCASAEEEVAFDLGQVVVTSTKKKARVLDLPASVTIITADDIEESGYSSTP